MKNHTDKMEQIAFDGLILGGEMPFFHKVNAEALDKFAEQMREVPFKRYTDNFYLCYSATGEDDKDFDWFHDFDWIIDNWRQMAAAAKKGGFKGICFDSEYYAGRPLFGYTRAKYHEEKSFAAYEAQVRLRGAEIMRAINESFPDVTLIMLFGYSGAFYGVPQHPYSAREKYALVPAFVDGMLSECGPEATIHDMHEQAFSFRESGAYARARAMMKNLSPMHSRVPEAYHAHHRAGFSVWADCWGDNSKGRVLDLEQFDNNYYTPDELAWTIHNALRYSDKYVWMWPGAFQFWNGQVKVVDDEGKEVQQPIPEAYLNALARAHEPHLERPPIDRASNTWRNQSAAKQEGYSDEWTFSDLWDTHEQLGDLPETWWFHTDPREVGDEQGWFKPDHPDRDWDEIRIREFWELQGHSPYDGCAWYRLRYTPPDLPAKRRAYLAFGGVAEEASVYVNGRRLYDSVYGDNIRHKRFLVDVTDVLQAGRENLIAVRVWNTGWCGGIWKSVKLIAEKVPSSTD
jgi:hypothetical protein